MLTSRIEYSITVTTPAPAAATGIRLVSNYAEGLLFAGSTTAHASAPRARSTATSRRSPPARHDGHVRGTRQLLAIGPLTTTVQRTQSTPADPNAANDRASKTCSALTGLLIRC